MLLSTSRQRDTLLFRKTNNTPSYINAFFNHSPRIIKQLHVMINKRTSDLSCNKEEFDKFQTVYETALKDSGYFSSMSFDDSNTQNTRRNRNRKFLWFNPSYDQNVKTNIGKWFINLVRNHFLKTRHTINFSTLTL